MQAEDAKTPEETTEPVSIQVNRHQLRAIHARAEKAARKAVKEQKRQERRRSELIERDVQGMARFLSVSARAGQTSLTLEIPGIGYAQISIVKDLVVAEDGSTDSENPHSPKVDAEVVSVETAE